MTFPTPALPYTLSPYLQSSILVTCEWHNQYLVDHNSAQCISVILFALFIQTINYWLWLARPGWHYLRLADITNIIPRPTRYTVDTISLMRTDTVSLALCCHYCHRNLFPGPTVRWLWLWTVVMSWLYLVMCHVTPIVTGDPIYWIIND